MPETLLESELFGHMKGSFTGAIATRPGLFEEAHGGTVFLDEASTISPATQVKLLRVLQERQVQRVGGGSWLPVDFRLLAASNIDLAAEVAEGRFREDLYFRLNVFPIHLPPLRERVDDIPLLANHFRTRFADENEVDPPAIPPETLRRMMDYDWPGNVRELFAAVESAAIRAERGRIEAQHLPETLRRSLAGVTLKSERYRKDVAQDDERGQIVRALREAEGVRARAAERLGMSRTTLWRKIKKYGLDSEA